MSDETEPTAENLARVLDEEGLTELARRARANEFHDYRSPHVMPEVVLAAELMTSGRHDLARRLADGEFDASREESQAWAASEDGQQTLAELGPGVADALGLPPDSSMREQAAEAQRKRGKR